MSVDYFDVNSGDVFHFIPKEYVSCQPHPIENYIDFTYRLGKLESTNRYYVRSSSGTFLGKYQFSLNTLYDVGIVTDAQSYLNNPILQEYALYKYLKLNKIYLGEYYYDYQGLTINGIHITNAGLLASAHLVGHVHVKRFLESNGKIIQTDGNGVPLTKYLQEFSDIEYLTLEGNVFNLYLTYINNNDTTYYDFRNTKEYNQYAI